MSSTNCISPRNLPDYWSTLTEDDKQGYMELQRTITPLGLRADKNQIGARFQIILSHVHCFAIRHDENDWKRCLVCGIAWLSRFIAISTRQFGRLIHKCRSSINAGFQGIGYGTVPTSPERAAVLIRFFPFLMSRCNEMRQWTIRAPPTRQAATNAEAVIRTLIIQTNSVARDPEDAVRPSDWELLFLNWNELDDDGHDMQSSQL
jgi:hypothetical protein